MGAQFDPLIDHHDEDRFADLRAAFPDQREILLVAEADGKAVGGALGFVDGSGNATLRMLAIAPDYRRSGIGRELLRNFERGAQRLGAESVSLGGDEEFGFYVRHGYRTMLLLQWVHDPALYETESAQVLNGALKDMEYSRSSFQGIPQLFVLLDEPNPVVRAHVSDAIVGAHVGYCMTRRLSETSP